MARTFGVLILASVLISAPILGYAFVSIRCFFAAGLSVYLAVRLPERVNNAYQPLYR